MVAQRSPKAFVRVQIFYPLPAERHKISKGGNMNQTELNFLQEALYSKCDKLLTSIVEAANAQVKAKEQPKTTKKGETK